MENHFKIKFKNKNQSKNAYRSQTEFWYKIVVSFNANIDRCDNFCEFLFKFSRILSFIFRKNNCKKISFTSS